MADDEDVYGLSADDRDIIQSLIAAYMSEAPTIRFRRADRGDTYTTEIHIALVPATTSIWGLVSAGTGTGTAPIEEEPDYADCPIYKIVPDESTETPTLVPVAEDDDFTYRVFNIGPTDIPGGSWIIVFRDKYGSWITGLGGGGGGSAHVKTKIERVIKSIDEVSASCIGGTPPQITLSFTVTYVDLEVIDDG